MSREPQELIQPHFGSESPLPVEDKRLSRVRHIFRWDLDKTYLKSDFTSVRDLVRTARLTAEERQNIPGARALLRAIQNEGNNQEKHLVYFLTGSPEMLRATIEKKFMLDGIRPEGFIMKPAVSKILKGRFRSLRNQIPYKLAHLLEGRLDAPVGSKETLFGDDAESDAYVYSLYADLVAGQVPSRDIIKILKATGAYKEERRAIHELIEQIVHETAVVRIIVHLDRKTPPASFLPYAPRVIPSCDHLQTALILLLDGTLSARAVRSVAWEMLEHYGFSLSELIQTSNELLNRRAPYLPLPRAEAIAEEFKQFSERNMLRENENESTQSLGLLLKHLETQLPLIAAKRGAVLHEQKRDYLELLKHEAERKLVFDKDRRMVPRIPTPVRNARK